MADIPHETNQSGPDGTPETRVPAATEPTPDDEPVSGDVLGLSRGDVRFALVCGSAILLLMLAHWAQRIIDGRRLVEIDRLPANSYEFRLDINSATWVEWMQLEGVGEVLARRIVSDRNERGAFIGIDDVSRVPGVGPKTLESIRSHLFCSDCPPDDSTP